MRMTKSPLDSCYSVMKLIGGITLSTKNFPYNQVDNFINIFNRNFTKEKLGTILYDYLFRRDYYNLVIYYSIINPDYYKSREYITNYLNEVIYKSTGSKAVDPFIDISKKEVIKSISNTFDLPTVASTYYCYYISQFLDENFTNYEFHHVDNILGMLELEGLNFEPDTSFMDNGVKLIFDSPEMFKEYFSSGFSDLSYIAIVHQVPDVINYLQNLDETEKLKFRSLLGDGIINTIVDEELYRDYLRN